MTSTDPQYVMPITMTYERVAEELHTYTYKEDNRDNTSHQHHTHIHTIYHHSRHHITSTDDYIN